MFRAISQSIFCVSNFIYAIMHNKNLCQDSTQGNAQHSL